MSKTKVVLVGKREQLTTAERERAVQVGPAFQAVTQSTKLASSRLPATGATSYPKGTVFSRLRLRVTHAGPIEGTVAKRSSKSRPTWTDIKAHLAAFDRAGLLDLIHHLYAAHKDNQAFLHARFGLGNDVLQPYKKTIQRWLWPNVLRDQDVCVSKAKQAISDYKKAVGDDAGLSELMVFYCEQAVGFCEDLGYQDEGFFASLIRMFEQALKLANTLAAPDRDNLIARLDGVREIGHVFGYGVGEELGFLLAKYTELR